MDEDLVGTLRTIGHDTEIWSLCGGPYPSDQLTAVAAAPTDGVRSEREDLCPGCAQILTQGDNPAVPLDAPGESGADDRGHALR